MGLLLNNKERNLFDSIAVEVMLLSGTEDPVLWKFYERVPGAAVIGQVDCLYEEPVSGSKHYVPYQVMCFYEEKEQTQDVSDDGIVDTSTGKVHFVRKNLIDKKVPEDETGNHVNPGDIIQLWSKNKRYTWYFDIINVVRTGWQLDADNWVSYACDVTRNESFTPEKKIIK